MIKADNARAFLQPNFPSCVREKMLIHFSEAHIGICLYNLVPTYVATLSNIDRLEKVRRKATEYSMYSSVTHNYVEY